MQVYISKLHNNIFRRLCTKEAAEKAIQKGQRIYNCFIDFTKAFDTAAFIWSWRQASLSTKTGLSLQRVEKDTSTWFATPNGMKQVDPVSPTVFITYLQRMETLQQNPDHCGSLY